MLIKSLATFAALAVSTALAAPSFAEGTPKRLSTTAYGTTSSGYAQAVAIGNMLKKNYDTELRIIPGKNDVSRIIPVQKGQADVCACGIAVALLMEGVFDYAKPGWGPQRIMNLFNNAQGRNGLLAMTPNDLGMKSLSDLKGKRVAYVRGGAALNVNIEAALAFGGLTWDDVTKVTFPGWKQATEGVVANQADAVGVSTTSSINQRLAASPRGSIWLAMPHDDTEGWKRMRAVAPYFNKRKVSLGVNIESNSQGTTPFEGAGYPYPAWVTYPDRDEAVMYELTKAVVGKVDEFKDAAPGAETYAVGSQVFDWVLPYHPGSIKYFKEVGAWTDAAEKHNQEMLRRQDVLAEAWKEMEAKKVSEDAFAAEWGKVRAAHLEKAGLPVPFR